MNKILSGSAKRHAVSYKEGGLLICAFQEILRSCIITLLFFV